MDQPEPISSKQVQSKYILLILCFCILLIIGLLAYIFSSNSVYRTNDIHKTSDTSNSPSQYSLLKDLSYLARVQGGDLLRLVYIISDPNGAKLNVSDVNMTKDSIKTIHQLTFPGASGFNIPVQIYNSYVIATYSGGDSSDIVIGKLDGTIITSSVRESNPELRLWAIGYGEPDITTDTERIKINLFTIASSQATAIIDLATGKMEPGSLVIIKK